MRFPPDPHPLVRAAPIRAVVVVLALALAACGSAGPSASPAAPSAIASRAPSVAPSSSPVAYPLTITDDEGTQVTIPAAPATIVSLTPATTELLFAIGLGPKIVGRTDADDYPPEAADIPSVASFTDVDVEKIVGLEPDLVIAGGNGFNPPDQIDRLRSLGIPVVVVYGPTVEGVLDDIRLVGRVAGAGIAAEALADSMASQFDAVRAVTADLEQPLVFYELDATSKIYTAADDSFLAEMISIAGGRPLTTGSTTNFEISLEQLVTANPSIILLGDAAYGVTADQVKSRPGWGTIQAVKSGAIYPVDDVVITRPGPRLVDGLLGLLRAIHPELAPTPLKSGTPLESGVVLQSIAP